MQLSTWCQKGPQAIAQIRDAQLAALTLPHVGYATAADWGGGCNIHCPDKVPVAHRLANSALALVYGRKVSWKSPTYASATGLVLLVERDIGKKEYDQLGRVHADTVLKFSATVRLHDVGAAGLTASVYPHNHNSTPRTGGIRPTDCKEAMESVHSLEPMCVWASLQIGPSPSNSVLANTSSAAWVNATVSVSSTGHELVLSASTTDPVVSDIVAALIGEPMQVWAQRLLQEGKDVGLGVLATAYGWGAIPMLNAYDVASNLPVLPWNHSITSSPS